MSLLRLAFWLALLVLLLPTDAARQARFTSFASSALERLSTFCDRNAMTCNVGAEAWATFLRKAEFGVRLVGDLLGAGGRQYSARGPGTPPLPDRRPGKADQHGTLSPDDVYYPPWRGPRRPKGD
jgi:hypothetical protein